MAETDELTMHHWAYKHWRDHAAVLAKARARSWCRPQLEILDITIELLAEMYGQDARSFDSEWFSRLAHKGQGQHNRRSTLHHE